MKLGTRSAEAVVTVTSADALANMRNEPESVQAFPA